jgi:hypothetical protein
MKVPILSVADDYDEELESEVIYYVVAGMYVGGNG